MGRVVFRVRNKFLTGILLFCGIAGFVPVWGGPALPAPSETLFSALLNLAPRINPEALQTAVTAFEQLRARGLPVRSDVLMVIDYTKPSTEPRLWVFDLNHVRVLFEELVAHGKNSGDNRAVRFSNQPGSLMSSLGAFLTGDTYFGAHGLSLRLQGLEKGVNDNSMERAIVIHAADYVNDRVGRSKGRLGRSWGCPAVRPEIARRLIETVQGGALLLAYYPEKFWPRTSGFAGLPSAPAGLLFPPIGLRSRPGD